MYFESALWVDVPGKKKAGCQCVRTLCADGPLCEGGRERVGGGGGGGGG
jgi:hypothetical protein